jgi:prephenate dehydrogenase
MRVAIIGGSGKMGQWFAGFLKQDGKEVIIHGRDREKLKNAATKLGVEAAEDLALAVKDADVVLLSVTINNFEQVVRQLQPLIKPGQIVIDITSVKTLPVEAMQKYLGAASILGTHPVFGPGAKGIKNQNVVLTPTNEKESALAERVKHFLEKSGARVSIMTPQEHDEMISIILGLAHFIAIVSADTLLNFKHLKEMASIAGPTYKVLLTLAESVLTEDPELYASIQMNLPRLPEIEKVFLKSSAKWAGIVQDKDSREFVNRMTALKNRMAEADPDFGNSYKAMYRIPEVP